MELVRLEEYHPEVNFWEMHGQLCHVPPWSLLKQKDRTKNDERSSKIAWGVALYAETSKRSIFHRLNEKDKIALMKRDFHLDFKNPLHLQLIEFYETKHLTKTQQQFKEHEKTLQKRLETINGIEWTLETGAELDRAHKASTVLWEQYLKLKEKMDQEDSRLQVQGGRELSATEQGMI